jgi:hypothetical protein
LSTAPYRVLFCIIKETLGIGEKQMSKKVFTDKEIKHLADNPYVKSVSSKGITYTEEFKQIFITENEKGKFPRQIFEDHDFDIDVIGMRRVRSAGKRWRAAYRDNGGSGLRDTSAEKSGRTSDKDLTLEERLARLEAQNNLLKAENELLKKIKFAERGMKRNH